MLFITVCSKNVFKGRPITPIKLLSGILGSAKCWNVHGGWLGNEKKTFGDEKEGRAELFKLRGEEKGSRVHSVW